MAIPAPERDLRSSPAWGAATRAAFQQRHGGPQHPGVRIGNAYVVELLCQDSRSKAMTQHSINRHVEPGYYAIHDHGMATDMAIDEPAPLPQGLAALRAPAPRRRAMPGASRARQGALPLTAGSRPGPGPRKAARASPRHSASAGRLIVPQAFRRGVALLSPCPDLWVTR